MKAKETLNDIWNKGKASLENQPVPDIGQVKKISRKHINSNRLVMLTYLSVYMLMLAATIVLQIMNLNVYSGNQAMLTIHAIILFISVAFLIYGIFLLRQVVQLSRPHMELINTIRSHIRLYKFHYEIWLWMVAFTVLLLTFAINSFTDNENGVYRINNPGKFALLEGVIFLFMYVILKAAHYPLLKELRAHLSDLENQTNKATARIEHQKRKWRWWLVAGMVMLAVALGYIALKGLIRYYG